MAWLIGVGLLVLILAPLAYMAWVMRWEQRETLGDRYFARTQAERTALKEKVRARGRTVRPIAQALAAVIPRKSLPSFEYKGVSGPIMTCSRARFEETANYTPDADDIFVATQMKCGTTWMQQVVYEVLSRGKGDFSDEGHRHMYALSPWIESRHSVSMEDAPRVGAGKKRIIKTHMPARLCPYSSDARYIYVLRHPVACFTSMRDFITMLAGPFAPPPDVLLDFYLSDKMYWLSWPEHADGWWRWAEQRPNVLFVHYEDMLDDLAGAASRVASFLEVDLTAEELAAVAHKSSFDYMKAHEEHFEMTPPVILASAGVPT